LYKYRCTIVPWFWFLTRKAACRIFQEKTVPEIINSIFKELGFTDVKDELTSGIYRKWEYCVQYRETDFNFISRLMENEGIYYYFVHENGKHTLHLVDDPGALKKVTKYETLLFDEPDVGSEDDACVWHWVQEGTLTSAGY